jgi:hypothetical protein
MKRGEVWWADLPPPTGRRPVVLLSRDEAYAVRALVTVASVTTRIRSIPAEVPLGPEDGLPRDCVANLDNDHHDCQRQPTNAHCQLAVGEDSGCRCGDSFRFRAGRGTLMWWRHRTPPRAAQPQLPAARRHRHRVAQSRAAAAERKTRSGCTGEVARTFEALEGPLPSPPRLSPTGRPEAPAPGSP